MLQELAGPSELQETPTPQPRPGEVLGRNVLAV